jgi:hypothetical protein
VASNQARGYAVEPRAGRLIGGVEGGSTFEGDPEDFSKKGVLLVHPDPAGQVAVQQAGMAVEEKPKAGGLSQ